MAENELIDNLSIKRKYVLKYSKSKDIIRLLIKSAEKDTVSLHSISSNIRDHKEISDKPKLTTLFFKNT